MSDINPKSELAAWLNQCGMGNQQMQHQTIEQSYQFQVSRGMDCSLEDMELMNERQFAPPQYSVGPRRR